MDKNYLSEKSLAKNMNNLLFDIEQLVKMHPQAPGNLKTDGTMVTALDLALSELIENLCFQQYPDHTFYSEEKYSSWKFPLIALDPLDGTREYMAGRAEWAVSVAKLEDNQFKGEGWIYNPITKEKYQSSPVGKNVDKPVFYGEVSRSEWERGLFKNNKSEKFQISPMGSIAYKLGRLSAHQIDFVVSLRPKNIWDIAAGTILTQESGYQFYSQGKKVTEVQKYYEAPLIWCSEENFLQLSELFH